MPSSSEKKDMTERTYEELAERVLKVCAREGSQRRVLHALCGHGKEARLPDDLIIAAASPEADAAGRDG